MSDLIMEMQRQARRLFTRHDHPMDRESMADEMVRENCGACVLNGYGADENGPNYAGWERTYVQAGKPIPLEWREAFNREINSDNELYAEALKEDMARFGVVFE